MLVKPDDQADTTEADTHEREADEREADDSESDDSSERSFSQADVERIVAERLARDRRSQAAKRARKSRQQNNPSEQADAEPAPDTDSSWRDDFYDATDGYQLTRGQRRRMRDAFRRERPDDPDAWIAEWADEFGIKRSGDSRSESPQPETEPSEPRPAEPSKSDKGAPSAPIDYDSVLDPNALSADDIKRIIAKYGTKEGPRKVRKMVEAWYTGRKVT